MGEVEFGSFFEGGGVFGFVEGSVLLVMECAGSDGLTLPQSVATVTARLLHGSSGSGSVRLTDPGGAIGRAIQIPALFGAA